MISLLLTFAIAAPADLPTGAARRLGTPDQRAPYYHLSWTADGKQIFGGDPDHQTWRTWDANTGRLTGSGVIPPMFRGLNDAQWRPGGRFFGWTRIGPAAQGGHPESVLFVEFDALAGKVVRDWSVNRADYNLGFTFGDVALSPDGRWIVGHENDMDIGGEMHVLDWEKKRRDARVDLKSNAWSHPVFTFAPDSKSFVMTESHSHIGSHSYTSESGKERWSILNGAVKSNAFTRDGEWWAVIAPENEQRAVSRSESETGRRLEVPPVLAIVEAHAVTVTPDDRKVIASGAKETVVWDKKTGKSVTLPVTTADLLPSTDGKSVVTCNGLLQKWDLETGKPLFADSFADGHTDEALTLTFSRDGSRLYSAATDGTIRIWDVATGKSIRVLELGERRFPYLRNDPPQKGLFQFSIDAKEERIATMGINLPLVVWDVQTGKEIRRVDFPRFAEVRRFLAPWGLRLAPDGKSATAIILDFPFRNTAGALHRLEWDIERGTQSYAPNPGRSVWPGEDRLAPDQRHWVDGRNRDIYRIADGALAFSLREAGFWTKQFDAMGQRLACIEILKEAEKNDKRWRSGLVVVSVPEGKTQARFALDDDQGRRRFAFDPRSQERIALSNGPLLQLRDMIGRTLWQAEAGERVGDATAMEISSTGTLATGHRDGTILLWTLPGDTRK